MLVSVVLCTYNGERYLSGQLESLLAQSLPPSEVVVADDVSTDQTMAILRAFQERAPFPVHIQQNAQRLGSTRNFDRAIRRASGEFIALCDQDDLWHSGKLETAVQLLCADASLGGVFSDADLIDEQGLPTGSTLFRRYRFPVAMTRGVGKDSCKVLLRRNVVTGATFVFRASICEHYESIPESWVHDGWIAWMVALHSRLESSPEALIDYRIHAAQQMGAPTLTGTLQRRGEMHAKHRKELQMFLNLLHYCESRPEVSPQVAAALREKCAFKQRCLELPGNRFARLLHIAAALPDYFRYSAGWIAIGKDLIMSRPRLTR